MDKTIYQVAVLRAYTEIEDVIATSEEDAISQMRRKSWFLGINSSMQKDLNKED